MTDKLICSFCNTELRGTLTTLSCQNECCEYSRWPMDSRIWQALIDGKKAQEALKVARQSLELIHHPKTTAGMAFCMSGAALRDMDKISEPKEE